MWHWWRSRSWPIGQAPSWRGAQELTRCALYGEADAFERPLPDQLHPDAVTHRLIGERFAALAFGPGGPLAA